MSLILLAAAAGLSQPDLDSPSINQLFSGYAQRLIILDLFVDPEGVVIECELHSAAMPEEASQRICGRAIGRDLGDGAKGQSGEAVYGELEIARVSVRDVTEGRLRRFHPRVPDLVVGSEASAVPAERSEINTLALIGADGRVEQCEPFATELDSLAELACSQATAHTFTIRHAADGTAVPYVGILQIDFVREQPAAPPGEPPAPQAP